MKDRRARASAAIAPATETSSATAPVDEGGMATIGELAAEFDITTRTIRFYEAKGLIAPERKGVARAYSRRDRARLILILRGKNLGFSLEDIKEYLALYDADTSQTAQVRLLKAKVEAHIDALNRKRADLDRTLKELKDIRAQVNAHLARSPDA